jgi:hypothetical protein
MNFYIFKIKNIKRYISFLSYYFCVFCFEIVTKRYLEYILYKRGGEKGCNSMRESNKERGGKEHASLNFEEEPHE